MARIMVCADCGREDRICGSFHPCESTRCLDCRPKALWRILGRNMGLGIRAAMKARVCQHWRHCLNDYDCLTQFMARSVFAQPQSGCTGLTYSLNEESR